MFKDPKFFKVNMIIGYLHKKIILVLNFAFSKKQLQSISATALDRELIAEILFGLSNCFFDDIKTLESCFVVEDHRRRHTEDVA